MLLVVPDFLPRGVRIGLQKLRRLIVYRTGEALGGEIEGIVAGEADFHETAAAVHGVNPGANEIAIVKNVAGHGHQVDAGQGGLKHLRATADGIEFEFTATLSANERATGGFHDDIARDFLEVNVTGDTLELHVTVDLLHVDESGLRAELKFGLFRHGQLKISFDFVGIGRSSERSGADIDAIANLLDVNGDLVGNRCAAHDDFRIL